MKKSEILKKAKTFLIGGSGDLVGKTLYICWAIDLAGDVPVYKFIQYLRNPKLVRELQQDVRQRIGHHFVVDDYLYQKLGSEAYDQLSYEDIQRYRHKLLNEMICHYESRGE